MDELERAYALRHSSDRARVAGHPAKALDAAAGAIAVYAGHLDRPLDLANALRLKALALDELDREAEAVVEWREARRLYLELGIDEGVTECDGRLLR